MAAAAAAAASEYRVPNPNPNPRATPRLCNPRRRRRRNYEMAAARDQGGGEEERGGENKTDRSIMDRITPRRRGKKGTNFVFPFSSLPPPDLGLGSNFLKKKKKSSWKGCAIPCFPLPRKFGGNRERSNPCTIRLSPDPLFGCILTRSPASATSWGAQIRFGNSKILKEPTFYSVTCNELGDVRGWIRI